jgi:nucleolar protein 4
MASVFVRGLNYDILDEQLHTYFEEVGPVKHAFIARDKTTNASRGFGFVEYSIPSDAAEAVARFHGQSWMGHRLSAQLAISKEAGKTRKDLKAEKLKEEKRLKNRQSREEKADFKAQLREAGIDLTPKSDLPADVVAQNDGRVLVISGFSGDVAQDRILASCRRVAPVDSFIFPSVESREGSLACRVTYETKEAAAKAARKFHEKDLRGSTVKAIVLEGKTAVKAARLIVRNLGFSVTEKQLTKLFSPYGTVVSVNLAKSASGAQRGFGFVQFGSVTEAELAIQKVNGTKLHSRDVVVDWSLPKAQYDRMLRQEAKNAATGVTTPAAPQEAKKAVTETDDMEDAEQDEDAEEEEDAEQDDEDVEQDDEDAEEGVDAEEDVEDEDVEDMDDEDVEMEEDAEMDEDDEEATETVEADNTPKVKSHDVHRGTTIFIRNLAYDTTENALHDKFSQFGRIKFCKIVMDRVLQRSMGTGFVQFFELADANAVLEEYEAKEETKDRKARFKKSAHAQKMLRLDGRDLILSRAVDRGEAKNLEENNKKQKENRRHLYLSREGLILPDTPAAEGLSKEDLAKRQRAWKEKREKLKNPNYHVSTTRLSVRNIPLDMADKTLKTLFRTQVVDSLREAGKKAGNVGVRQCKIVRDEEKPDMNGIPKSKGYGFVEFLEHEHALLALRLINNNPKVFTQNHRPIVEFALDDVRKVMVRNKLRTTVASKQARVEEVRKQAEEAALSKFGVASDDLKKVFAKQPTKQKRSDDGDRKNKKQRK